MIPSVLAQHVEQGIKDFLRTTFPVTTLFFSNILEDFLTETGNVFKGKEEASRFKQLILHAAAEQIVSFNKAADLLNQSLEEFEREIQIVP